MTRTMLCLPSKNVAAVRRLLLLLLTTCVFVEAFVVTAPPAAVTDSATSRVHHHYSASANHRHNRNALYSGGGGLEEGVGDEDTEGARGGGVGRRGILKTLMGSALSMAAGDLIMNAAVTAVSGGGVVAAGAVGLYERVLAFGSKYSGTGAVASEELMAWVAAQKVAASTPEIRAWLAAQRRLQMLRKATAAATTMAAGSAATTRRAAGGVIEEGLLAVAATTTAVKDVVSSTATNSTESLQGTGFANDDDESDCSKTVVPSSTNYKNFPATNTNSMAAAAEEFSPLTASASTDKNSSEGDISSSAHVQPESDHS